MPFVTDILGPRRPVAHQTSPLVGGRRRRTSTIGTHPDEPGGSIIDLRARDAVALAAGGVDVLGEIRVSAHLVNQVIEDIRHVGSRPQASGLDALRGCRVGPGFRSKVSALLPEEVQRASLLHLLLDDWVGAALVSGYGVQHEVEPLRARGMRRFRRLDMWPVDTGLVAFEAHFRDSHMDDDLVETIVHEYTVAGTVDPPTRTIKSVSAACGYCRGRNAPAPLEVRHACKAWASSSCATVSEVNSSASAPARISTTPFARSPIWTPCWISPTPGEHYAEARQPTIQLIVVAGQAVDGGHGP